MVTKAIREFNERYGLEDKKLLLAVSGGVDSVVLFDIYRKLKLNIAVASLNHGLRKEAEREVRYLSELCAKSSVPFYAKKLALKPKNEAEAREARYQFLNSVAKEIGAEHILTAHHADDQVETFLLKVVRGVGPLEMGGMAEKSNNVLRPMLTITKKEIVEYAKSRKLKYFTDKTNSDVKFSRNRIRSKIVPQFERLNPNFKKQLLASITLLEAERAFLKKVVDQEFRKVVKGETLDVERYRKLGDEFLRSEILKKYLKNITGVTDIYQKNIQELTKILQTEGTKRGQVKGFDFTKEGGFLSPTRPSPESVKGLIKLEGQTEFNGFLLKFEKKETESSKNNILLPPTLAYNLSIRAWNPGDRISTSGGTKKLQDIFTDAKISRAERKEWPVIVREEEIVWVPLLAKNKKYLAKNGNNINLVVEVTDARKKI